MQALGLQGKLPGLTPSARKPAVIHHSSIAVPCGKPAVKTLAAQQDNSSTAEQDGKKKFRSSWDAKEAGGGRGGGADYLYEVGAAANYNTNVDTGALTCYAVSPETTLM